MTATTTITATTGPLDAVQSNVAHKYILKQATTRTEMDSIMEVIWAANYTPYEAFAQLCFPVLGFLSEHREAAVAESKERFWNNHQSEPSSHWYFIEELSSGKAVGCAQWEIHLKNPFVYGPPTLQAPWWPEGDYRNFCELILSQTYKPRASWMTRPHVALNWMAVHPLYRRLGIGTLLMGVGIDIADQYNIEAWMEASPMGKPLYKKHGFQSLFKVAFDTEKPNASDIWRKCEHEMTPVPIYAMWRPKRGEWQVNGLDVKRPWELGVEAEVDKGNKTS